jgi:3-dehydroquinate synthase
VLERLGLPVAYRMRVDKKARGSRLRFVILEALARPSILEAPAEELLADVYREVCA